MEENLPLGLHGKEASQLFVWGFFSVGNQSQKATTNQNIFGWAVI